MTMCEARARGARRSKLLVPGDNWEFIVKSASSGADIVHLDLEDGVTAANKQLARDTIRRALDQWPWKAGQEVWIRIAHFDEGNAELDLTAIVGGRPNLIFMAKALDEVDMIRLDGMVALAEIQSGIARGSVEIGAVIERIKALSNVNAIANAVPRMGALVLGIVDLANEFGYRLTSSPGETPHTVYARSLIVHAAHAAGISAIDAPFMSYRDLDQSEEDAGYSVRLGFDGKSAISPKQVAGIHRAYSPTEKQIAWAKKVIETAEEATRQNKAIFSVDGQIIELPQFVQAERILARAS